MDIETWEKQSASFVRLEAEITQLRQQVAKLTEQRDQLLADEKESDAVRDRLAKLLSETAIALNGEEEALTRHSWHDLPVLALAAKVEAELMKQQRDMAVKALKSLSLYVAYNGDDWVSKQANAALAAIQSSEDTVSAIDLLPQERDCCGTFPRTPHRSTCPKYRGKKAAPSQETGE